VAQGKTNSKAPFSIQKECQTRSLSVGEVKKKKTSGEGVVRARRTTELKGNTRQGRPSSLEGADMSRWKLQPNQAISKRFYGKTGKGWKTSIPRGQEKKYKEASTDDEKLGKPTCQN